jgi:hypothetical protein
MAEYVKRFFNRVSKNKALPAMLAGPPQIS